jgi:hypothetical protein
MNVIFYANQSSPQRERLQRVIDILVPRERIESYLSIKSLEKRLHQHISEPMVFVLQVSRMQELLQLLQLRDCLIDRKLILILPDEDREIISRCHALRPRFITYIESDFIDVSVVLGKMLTPSLHRDCKVDYLDNSPEEPYCLRGIP